MVILLLIFMFFLGVTQVLWALLQGIVTRYDQVRQHFAYYGLGVVAYFVIWWFMFEIGHYGEMDFPFILHFFGGAAALCAYHVWIVAMSFRLGREADAAVMMEEWA
jgi:hypothetical protein